MKTTLALIVLGLMLASCALASVPAMMNYQGKLTDASGAPYNGTYNIRFYLYTVETGGTPVWQEPSVGTRPVTVSNGIFDVLLGSTVALPASAFTGETWLQTEVNGTMLSPRVRIVSVGYAMRAQIAEGIPDDSVTAAKIATDAVTASEIAADAVGTSEIAADAVTASEIAANAVTASEIATGAIGTSEIADGAVGSADISSDAVTSADIATDAVTTDEIADGTITTADIATGAVEHPDLAYDASSLFRVSGQAMYANSEGWVGVGDVSPDGVFVVRGRTWDIDAYQTLYSSGNYSSTSVWQSFTAKGTRLLSDISVSANHPDGDAWTATLYVYEGEGTSGTLLHYQGITGVNGINAYRLTKPVQMAGGSQYTFRFSSTSTLRFATSGSLDGYLDGRASFSATSDLFFSTRYTYLTSTPALFVDWASGDVGIGTNKPTQRLTVSGNICYSGIISACSDARFKEQIAPISSAMSQVDRLRPVSFQWKKDEYPDHQFSDGKQIGFIAQEVKEVLPQVVSEGSDGYLSVDYGRLTPILVQALKEQQKTMSDQQRQIDELRAGLEALSARSKQ